MFGYVIINKADMRFREFDTYHSYYCGLCKSLEDHFGAWGQLSLTYDMTFASILLSSLYEPQNMVYDCRCVAHPFEKQHVCRNEISDYVADMNVLLTIYKCEDDWNDEKKLLRKCYGDILRSSSKKQRKEYRDKENCIRDSIREMSRLEQSGCTDVDKMAGLFGTIMSTVFVYKDDEWAQTLSNIGYNLGRFVYLLDAYDDLEKDIKKKNYNPLINQSKEEGFDENIHTIMAMIMSECCKEFEMLPIIENVEILRNILYSGVWGKYEEIRDRRAKEKA